MQPGVCWIIGLCNQYWLWSVVALAWDGALAQDTRQNRSPTRSDLFPYMYHDTFECAFVFRYRIGEEGKHDSSNLEQKGNGL